MINQKEDSSNFVGIALFIMLFFLFVSSYSDTAVKYPDDSHRVELISPFLSSPLSADIVSVIKLPPFHQNWVSSQDKMNFSHYDRTLRICSDNRKVNQELTSLQRQEFLTKNIVFYRYYYHLFPLVNTDLPGLS